MAKTEILVNLIIVFLLGFLVRVENGKCCGLFIPSIKPSEETENVLQDYLLKQ